MLQKIGDSLKGKKTVAYVILVPLVLVFAVWGAAGVVDLDFFSGASWAAKVDGTEIPPSASTTPGASSSRSGSSASAPRSPRPNAPTLQDALLEQAIRETLIQERTSDLGYRVGSSRDRGIHPQRAGLPARRQVQRKPRAGAPRADRRDDRGVPRRDPRQPAERRTAARAAGVRLPHSARGRAGVPHRGRAARSALCACCRRRSSRPPWRSTMPPCRPTTPGTRRATRRPRRSGCSTPSCGSSRSPSQVTVAETDLQDLYAKNRDRYVDPEKRAAAPHPRQHRGGQGSRGAEAGRGDRSPRRASPAPISRRWRSSIRRTRAPRRRAATSAGPSAAPSSGRSPTRVFAMKQGELRGPVKTEFGYHVIRLDGIQPSHVKTYDEARPELESEFRRERAADLFGERQEQVQRKLEEPNADLARIATDLGLAAGEVAEFGRGTGGAPLGADPALDEVVFGDAVLNQRRIGGPGAARRRPLRAGEGARPSQAGAEAAGRGPQRRRRGAARRARRRGGAGRGRGGREAARGGRVARRRGSRGRPHGRARAVHRAGGSGHPGAAQPGRVHAAAPAGQARGAGRAARDAAVRRCWCCRRRVSRRRRPRATRSSVPSGSSRPRPARAVATSWPTSPSCGAAPTSRRTRAFE